MNAADVSHVKLDKLARLVTAAVSYEWTFNPRSASAISSRTWTASARPS